MGFNHGLYWALKRTLTLSFWQVESTCEWWWKIALSMNRTTLFWACCGSDRIWNSNRYNRSSNRVASYAPSTISLHSNWSLVIAAMKDIEYTCFFTSLFLIDKSNVLNACSPSWCLSLFWDLSYKVLPTMGTTTNIKVALLTWKYMLLLSWIYFERVIKLFDKSLMRMLREIVYWSQSSNHLLRYIKVIFALSSCCSHI